MGHYDRSDEIKYPTSFSVRRRNYGHWDIIAGRGRAFRLRGGPGHWLVIDERTLPGPDPVSFKEQSAAMSYICAELMHEILATESQHVHRIEDWNVPDGDTFDSAERYHRGQIEKLRAALSMTREGVDVDEAMRRQGLTDA